MARRLPVLSGLIVLSLVLTAVPVAAEAPFPVPPTGRAGDYPATTFITSGDCEAGNASTNDLPANFDCEGDWKFTDHRDTGTTSVSDDPHEFYGVKGVGLNRAWEISTGRPDVVIAVMDSGIRWEEAGRENLVRKHFVNRGELPLPQGPGGATRHNPQDTRFDGYDVDGDTNADGIPDGAPDGMFNVVDYWADPRVTDLNLNGVVDPEDLIRTFSDGVDDDGNGYVDDISGWDFFEDDNNPQDDVDYGHGTGEAEDSGAEAGYDDGTCPNCMILSMRVGDSFVADVNHFAEAVVYAVDNGASVVQEALGTLNHTSFGQAAIDYAYRNGVIVNASMADEAAGHHMWPAAYDHTMPVNSIRTATLPTTSPQSTLYFNGCTNFGGYLYLAIPSTSCSSEATGRSSGYSGLLYSAARNAIERGAMTGYLADDGIEAPSPLSAEEAMQLWRLSADDIDFASTCGNPLQPDHSFCDDAPADVLVPDAPPDEYTTSIPASQRYRTTRGWDYFTGYGRPNVARLLRFIGIEDQDEVTDREYDPAAGAYGVGPHHLTAQDRIPPEADLRWPRWWHQYGHREDGSLLLPDDPDDPTKVVIQGRVAANRVTAAGGTFDWILEYAPHVQGDAAAPGADASGESSGGPWTTISTGEGLSAAYEGELGRVDVQELAAALAATPNPFPAAEDPTSEFQPERYAIRLRLRVIADPAVNHDADPTNDDHVNNEALHQKQIDVYPATELAIRDDIGVPVTDRDDPGIGIVDQLDPDGLGRYAGGAGSPSYVDLDGDGTDELLLPTSDGVIHAYTDVTTGAELPGWPVLTRPYPGIVRHRTGDGSTPVDNAYVRGDVTSEVYGGVLLGTLAAADLDDDGDLEVAIGDLEGNLNVWEHDGTPRDGFPVAVDRSLSEEQSCEGRGMAAGGDAACDDAEAEDVLGPGPGGPKRDRWNNRDWGINSAPAIGDLDPTTPGLELVVGANDSHVYAWHEDGTPVAGWPVVLRDPAKVGAMDPDTRFWEYAAGANQAIGAKVLVSPALGDLDGDGDLEVVIGVNEEYEEPTNTTLTDDPVLSSLGSTLGSGNTRLYVLHHTGAATPATAASEATPHVHDQAYAAGWPVPLALLVTNLLPYVAAGTNTQPALFDADGDGDLEIATASAAGPAYLLEHDGSSALGTDSSGNYATFATTTPGLLSVVSGAVTAVVATLPSLAGLPTTVQRAAILSVLTTSIASGLATPSDTPSYVALGGLAVGSLDGGATTTVVGSAGGLRRILDVLLEAQQLGGEDHLAMWSTDGKYLPTAPVVVNDLQFFNHPTVADVDGDGEAEALQGTAVGDLVAAGRLDGTSGTRREFTGGWMVTSPTVGAASGLGGAVALTSVTREGYLRFHATGMQDGTTAACIARSQWPEYGHDPHNTANLRVDARRPGPLTGLSVSVGSDRRATLTFTATGDDGTCGRAAAYEIRLARAADAGWSDGTPVAPATTVAPATPGAAEELVTAPLALGTWTLMLRARDEAGNGSPVARVRLRVQQDSAPDDPPGDPTTPGPVALERLSGPDRYSTGVAVSQAQYPAAGSARAVVLARGDDFADALAGTPFAVAQDGPLLLTPPGGLLDSVADEIVRVLPRGGIVHLLGGDRALSPAIAERLTELGYRVRRIAGDTRYTTALAVAHALGTPDLVLVTRGDDFADALTAGVAAARLGGAVVLTPEDLRHPDTDAYLAATRPDRLYAVGGPAARPYGEATALVGTDRVATALVVAETLLSGSSTVGLARADGYPDALTGGVDVARRGGAMLLTPSGALDERVGVRLCRQAHLTEVVLYGGTNALGAGVADGVRTTVAGC